MPGQNQQQNKNPGGGQGTGVWQAVDQNFLGGMGPGGAQPFFQTGINQFNQGRDVSRENGGGGLRQTGRGLLNVVDGNLLGGMFPGGVTPRQVFFGQPSNPAQPQDNQPQPSQGGSLYNRVDSLFGNRLPGGNQAQGKNPQPSTGMGMNFPTQNGMPLPVQIPNPRETGMPSQIPQQQHPQDQSGTGKNPGMNNGQSPMVNRPGYMQSQYDALNPLTTSGGAFNSAVNHYGSLQRPNRFTPQ